MSSILVLARPTRRSWPNLEKDSVSDVALPFPPKHVPGLVSYESCPSNHSTTIVMRVARTPGHGCVWPYHQGTEISRKRGTEWVANAEVVVG